MSKTGVEHNRLKPARWAKIFLASVAAGFFGSSCLGGIAKCVHFLSRRARNRTMRAINGNGGAARTSARKRQQKAPSFSLQDLMKLFQHMSVILQMLKGHDLGQLLSMFTDFVPMNLDSKQTERKRKRKLKKGTSKSTSTGGGAKTSDTPAPAVSQSRTFADVAKSGKTSVQTQASKPVPKSQPAEFTPVWCLRQSDWNGEIHTLTLWHLCFRKPRKMFHVWYMSWTRTSWPTCAL